MSCKGRLKHIIFVFRQGFCINAVKSVPLAFLKRTYVYVYPISSNSTLSRYIFFFAMSLYFLLFQAFALKHHCIPSILSLSNLIATSS